MAHRAAAGLRGAGSSGFVHLSTPGQVRLPAERPFPRRDDLVLLVVDPPRLSDPVRWKPGHPGDPEGRLFPRLHGPLPTRAVVAVVPYRPPLPPLPRPGDPLARALAFCTSVPVRRAAAVADVPGGVAVLDPDFASSHDNNRLLLTAPVDAGTVEATAGEVGGHAGSPHRAALMACPGSGRWRASWLPWPARRGARPHGPPAGPAGRGRDGGRRGGRPARGPRPLGALVAAGPGGTRRPDRAVVRQLVGRERLNDCVVAVTDVVVREGPRRGGRPTADRRRHRGGGVGADRPRGPGPWVRRRRPGAGPGARRRGGMGPSSCSRRPGATGRGTGTPGAPSHRSARPGGSTGPPEG